MLALALPLVLAYATPTAIDFAAEGEAHLQAAETAVHPLDALQDAHASFDSAYLVDGDAGYLCRALLVAERALQSEEFTGDDERRSWEETRREDLERLQHDAEEKKRANCRFAADGKSPALRVACFKDSKTICRIHYVTIQYQKGNWCCNGNKSI